MREEEQMPIKTGREGWGIRKRKPGKEAERERKLQAPRGLKWSGDRSKTPRDRQKERAGIGREKRKIVGAKLQVNCAPGPNFRLRKGQK